ncbi:MAG: hypothetical protein U0795_05320 [Pirellulales bacterium]
MTQSNFKMHDCGDDEQLASYRPVSWLAVATLLTGLLSAVAAVSTYFIWLPAVPLLLGTSALVQIRRQEGRYLGRLAALIGMILAGVFFGLKVGQLAHAHRVASNEARQFADGWLKLLTSGRWEAADQGTLARSKRNFSSRTVQTGYETDPKLQKQWADFVKQSPVCQKLLDWGPDTQIRYVKDLQQRYLKDQRAVQLLYEVTPPGQQPLQVRVWVIRDDPLFSHPATWWAKQVELVED